MIPTFLTHSPIALLAGTGDTHAAYLSFFQSVGYHVISLDLISDNHFPYMHSLYELSYDLLILPGGGDFSPALYQALPDTNACSAFVESVPITPYESALDMLQFSLLTDALHKHVPIIGICKGMQLLNVYFGGSLYEDMPGSIHSIPGEDCFHSLITVSPVLLSRQMHLLLPDILYQSAAPKVHAILQLLTSLQIVNSAHHQGIHKLASDFICLQRAPDRICETIIHAKLPIIGFQWHPERLPDFSPLIIKDILQHLL